MAVSAILPELPSVTVDAWFARVAWDPGDEVPGFKQDGAALLLVRSGGVTLRSDLPIIHRRAGETGPPTPVDVPPDGLLLPAGEGAFARDAMQLSISSVAGEPADILLLMVYSRVNDDVSTPPGTTSAPTQLLGAGPLTFHTGGAILMIEQDIVAQGNSDYSATLRGTEFGTIEAGDARVLAQRGMTWHTPGGMDTNRPHLPGADLVEIGGTIQLEGGDSYASYDGSLVWRAGMEEALVTVRAQVIPLPQPA